MKYEEDICADIWLKMIGYAMERISIDRTVCKHCQSTYVVKNGTRKGTQYWLCRECGKGFVDNRALPKSKYPMEAVGSGLYMYFTGSSLNDIKNFVKQQYGLYPSDSAIYGWVTRFSKIASEETEKHKPPHLGDVWIADELYLSIGGKRYYLWDIIDAKTRYLIATYLSPNRGAREARKLMELASQRAGKVPKVVITDSLNSYLDGIELAYGSETRHIQSQPFAKTDSTNLIERWHATLRERTKVMWGMKKPETAKIMLGGFLAFYNYFRPHESLNDRTPAEVAGVKFPHNNWLDLVKHQLPVSEAREFQIKPKSEFRPLITQRKPNKVKRVLRHRQKKEPSLNVTR